MFIIFDLDDTLANTEHRQHLLEKEYASDSEKWNTFFDACDEDAPHAEIIELLRTLDHQHRIEIWTGRSEQVREKTEKWLYKHVGFTSQFLMVRMRKAGDVRPDTEVKADWVRIYGKHDVVFDDRNKMVNWWRQQGITCCQVNESDF